MRSKTSPGLVAALVAFVACTAGVAGVASSATDTTATVRIGLEGPLSGDQKSIGIGMLDGAKLAAAEINARGGLLGKKVEIVPIDDAADPATGVDGCRPRRSTRGSTASSAPTTPVWVRRRCRSTSPPGSCRSV